MPARCRPRPTSELSAESCRRTVEAMRRFRAIADAMGVPRIDVIATEAIRRASNGDRLVASIAQEAGFAVRVLTGAEEAHYAALGVIAGFYRPSGLVGDMGGGSLEVAGSPTTGSTRIRSACPWRPSCAGPAGQGRGRREATARRASEGETGAGLAQVSVLRRRRRLAGLRQGAYGVSRGASARCTRIRAGCQRGPRLRQDTFGSSEAKLATLPGVPARRVQTLPAAALVLDRVLKRLAPERVVFSALGLREGWLYAQLATEEQYLDPLVEGAQAFGIPHARVAALAPALVRWTDTLFPDETPQDRRLRVAACAVSDISWRDHASVQAPESFRRLVQFPLIGLDHAERVFLAAAIHARYAGRPAIQRWRRRPICCLRVRVAGHWSSAASCSWDTASRVACLVSWRARACGSKPTRCGSRSAR